MEAKNASVWNIFNAEKYVLKIQKHSEIKQLDSSNRVQKWEPDNVPARKYYQKQCLSVGGARHVAVQKSAHHVSNWGRTTPALMQPSIASLVSFRLHHISSYRPDHYLNFNLEIQVYLEWNRTCPTQHTAQSVIDHINMRVSPLTDSSSRPSTPQHP